MFILKGMILYILHVLICPTIRIVNKPQEDLEQVLEGGKNVVFSVWHESTAMCFFFYRYRNAGILVADNPNGKALGLMSRLLGYIPFPVMGKLNDRSSIKNTLAFLSHLKGGHDGTIAVDGPAGPYHKPKTGIFHIAHRSGNLILPIGVAYSHRIKSFWRWDKYQIPLPFCKCALVTQGPLPMPPEVNEENIEELSKRLKQAMDDVTAQAEQLVRKPKKHRKQ